MISSKSLERAAGIVRVWAEDPTLAGRLSALTVQEAFVAFFRDDPTFSPEQFRQACKPIRKTA